MSTPDCIRMLAALVLVSGWSSATGQQSPGLGVPVSPGEFGRWAITVLPDGTGLPAGSGNAREGAEIYARKCAACHGAEGAGRPNDRLVGGHGTIATASPVRTLGSYWPYATTVFDYIRRAMPYTQPQSLTDDETYAVTAYLLHLNGIIAEDAVMDARTLPLVAMPNRDNFFRVYRAPGE